MAHGASADDPVGPAPETDSVSAELADHRGRIFLDKHADGHWMATNIVTQESRKLPLVGGKHDWLIEFSESGQAVFYTEAEGTPTILADELFERQLYIANNRDYIVVDDITAEHRGDNADTDELCKFNLTDKFLKFREVTLSISVGHAAASVKLDAFYMVRISCQSLAPGGVAYHCTLLRVTTCLANITP